LAIASVGAFQRTGLGTVICFIATILVLFCIAFVAFTASIMPFHYKKQVCKYKKLYVITKIN
jgi:archaellin